MEGTLVVQEKRKTIDKFRDWYKQKVIDSELAVKFEKIIDSRTQVLKKKNDFLEKVLPSIVARIPDVAFLAPLIPVLSKVGKFKYDLEEAMIIKAKRFVENVFIGVDGSCLEVTPPTINFEGLDEDVETIVAGIQNGTSGEEILDEEYTEGFGRKK